MRGPSSIQAPPGVARAFTLVEMLVSMAVLVMLFLLVSQLTNATALTVALSGKHMDADTQARLIFSRMDIDFANMVKRADVDYSSFKSATPGTLPSPPYNSNIATNTQTQPGNDFLAFYAETNGYYSGSGPAPTGAQKSAVSLVAYQMAPDTYNQNGEVSVLRRLGKTLGWEPNAPSLLGMTYLPGMLLTQFPNLSSTTQQDADYQTIGNMVLRVEYTYLLKPDYTSKPVRPARLSTTPWDKVASPAHTSINGFQDVAAVAVAIVVLDSQSRRMVANYGKLTDNSLFKDAVDGANDPKYSGDIAPAWNAVVNSPDFATNAGIPPAAASAVRVYERYFYLNAGALATTGQP